MKIMCNPLLPIEYQQVEYIQGDGRSYINSNFIPSYVNGFDIIFKVAVNSTSTSLRYCLLSNYNKAPNPLSLELQSNAARFWQGGNLVDLTGTLTTNINNIEFKYENNTVTCICNGVTKTSTKSITAIPTETMQFFCDKEFRTTTFTGYMKLYSCKIFIQNKLVRDFVPCYRKSDNKIGLYELVEKVFLSNTGSVDFTKGSNVNNYWNGILLESATIPSYLQKVEYIQSTGTQYIDLDYVCKVNNLNIELDMAWTGTNTGDFETFIGFMQTGTTPRIGLHKYQSKLMFGANATTSSGETPTTGQRFIYKGDFTSGAQKLYKNGGNPITNNSTTYNFSSNTCPLYIFARYCPSSMNKASMRLYSCTIKEGTTTVRNLIPCYNINNNEIGLYDLISQHFFTNSGTGIFQKGNNIYNNPFPLISLSPALPEVTLLPKIYHRLSYIGSNGTAYLNTGLPVHMNWKYEIIFQQNDTGKYRGWGAFDQPGYAGPNCSLTYISSPANFVIRWESRSGQQTYIDCGSINTNKHTFIINNGVVTFDGVNKGTCAGHSSSFTTSFNAYLFTINPGGTTPSATLNGKIYSYKVWDNTGVLQQWFIPCENKITGEAGMYDIIQQEFHGNISTGNFQKGEVI